MIPEGTEYHAVTQTMAQEVIDAVTAYLRDSGTKRSTIAKSIGIAASTLGQVLNWKYSGNWQQVILDLDRWRDEQLKRDALPKTSQFVWTSVALDIKDVADIVSATQSIGLVYGPKTSGIGKTMALKAIAAEKAGAIMVTAEKVNSSVAGLLRSIARALRIGEAGGQAYIYERVKHTLSGTSRLLIIDQIHNLCFVKDDRPLFVLCDLFDATGAPQLWCGTTDIIQYLDRGQSRGRETLAQIRRRIFLRRDLMQRTYGKDDGGRGEPLFSIDDIRAVFAKNKLRLAPDAAMYLMRLANLDDCGGLGTCCQLVRAATLANEETATVLTGGMLKALHRTAVNDKAFTLLEARMEEYARLIAKAG